MAGVYLYLVTEKYPEIVNKMENIELLRLQNFLNKCHIRLCVLFPVFQTLFGIFTRILSFIV